MVMRSDKFCFLPSMPIIFWVKYFFLSVILIGALEVYTFFVTCGIENAYHYLFCKIMA